VPVTLYLDANALIGLVEGDARDPAVAALRRLPAFIDTGTITLVASQIALAEVLVLPIRTGNSGLLRVYRDEIARFVTWIPVDVSILDDAGACRARRTGLRLPDAIHIATARQIACDGLVSGDRRLPRDAGIRLLDPEKTLPAYLDALA
jgi:predicted nucleic acid-binding protein